MAENFIEMRKHLSWYTKGMPDSAEMRRKINTAKSKTEMELILRETGVLT
jgi:tRNA-dihydrouridine synthase B